MTTTTIRTEFGIARGSGCTCRTCRRNCMFMPGFLIPADLDRMIPESDDPFEWADVNLLASPGAIVMKDGEMFRIPTLVMANREDGSCIYFVKRRCAIWQDSPFGCAFFGCGQPEQERLSQKGLYAVHQTWHDPESLYGRLWQHLVKAGRIAASPEEKRARMNES